VDVRTLAGMAHTHHAIDYIELRVSDLAAAKAFYGSAFGWAFNDLDGSVSAVEAAGGEVVEGPYEFPGGRRFHFTDPSGNELGVWATA
jgi:uncharacterized protein